MADSPCWLTIRMACVMAAATIESAGALRVPVVCRRVRAAKAGPIMEVRAEEKASAKEEASWGIAAPVWEIA